MKLKRWQKISIWIVAALAILLIVANTLPDSFFGETPPITEEPEVDMSNLHITTKSGSRALWWGSVLDGVVTNHVKQADYLVGCNDCPEFILAFSKDTILQTIKHMDAKGNNVMYACLLNYGPGDTYGNGHNDPKTRVVPFADSSKNPKNTGNLASGFVDKLTFMAEETEKRDIIFEAVVICEDTEDVVNNLNDDELRDYYKAVANVLKDYKNTRYNIGEEVDKIWRSGKHKSKVRMLAAAIRDVDKIHPIGALPLSGREPVYDHLSVPGTIVSDQFKTFSTSDINKRFEKIQREVPRIVPVGLTEAKSVKPRNSGDCNSMRRIMWTTAMGGTFEAQTFNRFLSSSDKISDWDPCWDYGRVLKEFMRKIPWGEMTPKDSSFTEGFGMTSSNTAVNYLPNGGSSGLKLEGDWSEEAYNTKTGQPISTDDRGERVVIWRKK